MHGEPKQLTWAQAGVWGKTVNSALSILAASTVHRVKGFLPSTALEDKKPTNNIHPFLKAPPWKQREEIPQQ